MRKIVLSAINIYQSGMLTIAREFLRQLCATDAFARGEIEVTFFVHRAELYADLAQPRVTFIEKPRSRQSWFARLFYEYVYFAAWSARREIDTWISLHDVSPTVRARRRMVYCHNPMPFYGGALSWRYDAKLMLMKLFYSYVYRLNLNRNDAIIMQQQWMRDEFVRRYGCDARRVIVATPTEMSLSDDVDVTQPRHAPLHLIYPTFPRQYKNYEVVLDAMRALTDLPLKLALTFDGSENAYAQSLVQRYADLTNVRFSGFLTRAQMDALYADADAMVFASKSETWGLPLSEFRRTRKPIFAADLPYAHEALSGYSAGYFAADDAPALAMLLRAFVTRGAYPFTKHVTTYAPPHARNWRELMQLLGFTA